MNSKQLEGIKRVLSDYEKASKGVMNTGAMADYAVEVIPELIAEIERLHQNTERLTSLLSEYGDVIYEALRPYKKHYEFDRDLTAVKRAIGR